MNQSDSDDGYMANDISQEETRKIHRSRPTNLGVGTEYLASVLEDVRDSLDAHGQRLGQIEQAVARGSEKFKQSAASDLNHEVRISALEKITRNLPLVSSAVIGCIVLMLTAVITAVMNGVTV